MKMPQTAPWFGLIVLGFSATQPAVAAHTGAAPLPEIEWDTSLDLFQFDADKFIGQRFSVVCPPLPVNTSTDGAFGTDVYPSNTPICVAALHAGEIGEDGGPVSVQLNPGETEYAGSIRNGVTTDSLPGTQRSMTFIGGARSASNDSIRTKYMPRLKWDTKFTATGLAYRRLMGQQFSFNCPAAPADMRPRRVSGTDSYAFHSMVCRAAVHAGEITTDGGIVTVRLDPGVTKLVGSIRNGVETSDGPGGHTTISFVGKAGKGARLSLSQ